MLRWIFLCYALSTYLNSLLADRAINPSADEDQGDWDGWPYDYAVTGSGTNEHLWDSQPGFTQLDKGVYTGKESTLTENPGEDVYSLPKEELGTVDIDVQTDDNKQSLQIKLRNANPENQFVEPLKPKSDNTTLQKRSGWRKKRQEARLIRRITQSFEDTDYFAVLGLQRRLRFRIRSRTIPLIPNVWSITIPPVFDIKPETIKSSQSKLKAILSESTNVGAEEALQKVNEASFSLLHNLDEHKLDWERLRRKGKREGGRLRRASDMVVSRLGPCLVPFGIVFMLVV